MISRLFLFLFLRLGTLPVMAEPAYHATFQDLMQALEKGRVYATPEAYAQCQAMEERGGRLQLGSYAIVDNTHIQQLIFVSEKEYKENFDPTRAGRLLPLEKKRAMFLITMFSSVVIAATAAGMPTDFLSNETDLLPTQPQRP